MYIIYCLQNESLKSNILSFGIISSLEDLKQLVKDINKNKTFLPSPYNVFLTKRVNNPNSIEQLYTLLGKFGKNINNSFFEIQIEIVKQVFELIDDNTNTNTDIKYIVVQDKIEYSIPNIESEDSGDYEEVIYTKINKTSKPPIPPKKHIPSISVMIDELDNHYDRLNTIKKSKNSNDNNYNNDNNNVHSDLDL